MTEILPSYPTFVEVPSALWCTLHLFTAHVASVNHTLSGKWELQNIIYYKVIKTRRFRFLK